MAIINETATLPTTTAYDLIESAFQILGDLAYGEILTSAQSDIGLKMLNSFLDSLSIQRLSIYQVRQEEHTWTANAPSMTIGPGADLDTRRPDRVENGTYFRDSNDIAYPVDVIRNREVYDNIRDKSVESTYPELIFYDPSITIGTLYVYPVPNETTTLVLNTWQPLQIFENLTEALVLPPGYKLMIENNLAKHLEAKTGLPLPASALRIANESLTAVKRHNNLPIVSVTETAYVLRGRGRTDIRAGK
jgi:hypothetical protein